MPALDDAAFNLDVGARSDIVESPAGFHLLKRLE
jgi:parvulin-like peptidyl-prolyl isomerase